jgi:mono/diheme cytochrome c family protein
MADQNTDETPVAKEVPASAQDAQILQNTADTHAVHDDHSGFHNYSGGVIIERGDRPILPYFFAVAGVFLVILVGFFLGGYQAAPKEASDSTVANLTTEMASQTTSAAMTNPYMIDMYQLPRPGGESLKDAISNGSDVYQHYCIGCHGPNQDGAGPNAVSLNPMPRNLRDQPFIQGLSYQRAWTSLHKGVPGTAMPRWENTLSDDQIREVICYVFSLTAPTDKSGNYISPKTGDLNNNDNSVPIPLQQVPAAQH